MQNMQNMQDKAFAFWEKGNYKEALDVWQDCLEQGMFVEEILAIFEEAFIEPNRMEVAAIYKDNMLHFLNREITLEEAAEECRRMEIKFLCFADGNYYVLDTVQKKLLGYMDISRKFSMECVQYSIFEDVLLVYPRHILDFLRQIKSHSRRTVYCLGSNQEICMPLYTLPEIKDILENGITFFPDADAMRTFFLENPARYLPKMPEYRGEEADEACRKCLDELHKLRCKKEYRDESNILLSICIPTWNRGERALEMVQKLLDSGYDAELEIVVSDNASTKGAEAYKRLENMDDARLSYYRADHNTGFIGNYKRVLEFAKGKYALLMSDEDYVLMEHLPSYLAALRNSKDLGLLMGSGDVTRNRLRFENKFFEAGDPAFERVFLGGNYISGDIYLCNQETRKILDRIYREFEKEECFIHYPHMVYSAFLADRYPVATMDMQLIVEGDEAEEPGKEAENVPAPLNSYMTLESRIKQMQGWRKVLEKVESVSIEQKECQLMKNSLKALYLLSMVEERLEMPWETVMALVKEAIKEDLGKVTFLSESRRKQIYNIILELIRKEYCG